MLKINVQINNENYHYDNSRQLTYEDLKMLGVGKIVWCEYSNDWFCRVENEEKTIVKDGEEIDLRGSFCCIGDLKETMNRNETTIKVYELYKSGVNNKDIDDLLYILNKRIGFTEYEYNIILSIAKKYNFEWHEDNSVNQTP